MKRKKFINFSKLKLSKKIKSIFLKKYFDRKLFFKSSVIVFNKKLNFLNFNKFFFLFKQSVLPLFFSFYTIKNISFFFFLKKNYLLSSSETNLIVSQIGLSNLSTLYTFFSFKTIEFYFNKCYNLKIYILFYFLFLKFFFFNLIKNCYYLNLNLVRQVLE